MRVRESLPCDIAREIEVGCRVFTWQNQPNTERHTIAVWPDTSRAAYGCGGDSSWGEWLQTEGCLELDANDELGATIYIRPLVGRVCREIKCTREAIVRDPFYDMCCVEHAARAENWVILTPIHANALWCDSVLAEKIVDAMSEIGYEVEIREPTSIEAEGTYSNIRGDHLIPRNRIDGRVYDQFRRDLERERYNLTKETT